MKVMAMWTLKPNALREAVSRFLAGKGNPPEGAKLLGRWHSVDLTTGFTLLEVSDPRVVYQASTDWADLLSLEVHIVVEDQDVGPLLATAFQ